MKIVISSCLLGENVRYDGRNSNIFKNDKISDKEIFAKILSSCEIFSFCPEVSGGLSIPRKAVEIISFCPLKVLSKDKIDKSKEFLKGATNCLKLCQKEGIKVALFKANSPSCGNENIYDGTFCKKLKSGSGVCAKLLLKNNIKVFNENQLAKLHEYILNLSKTSC